MIMKCTIFSVYAYCLFVYYLATITIYNVVQYYIMNYEMYNVLFHCFHSPTYIRSFHGAAITITITIKTLINFFIFIPYDFTLLSFNRYRIWIYCWLIKITGSIKFFIKEVLRKLLPTPKQMSMDLKPFIYNRIKTILYP